MSNQSKLACFIFALFLVASSLIVIGASTASIPTPSVPEFTLRATAHPYDVAPRTTTNPYTGETTVTDSGSHQENKSIEVTIKNQPFTPYTDEDGNVISLYYDVTYKGHFGSVWETMSDRHYTGYINASSSDFTVVSIPLRVPAGSSVDYRVMALVGYQTTTPYDIQIARGYAYEFTGQTSGWSPTKTISPDDGTVTVTSDATTAPQSLPTPNPYSVPDKNPTVTPTQPATQVGNSAALEWEQIAIIVVVMLLGVVAVLFAVIGVLLRRKNK